MFQANVHVFLCVSVWVCVKWVCGCGLSVRPQDVKTFQSHKQIISSGNWEKRKFLWKWSCERTWTPRHTQIIQHTHTHTQNVSLWKHSALLISDRLIRFTLLFEVAVSILCLCLSGSLWRRISRSEVSRRKNHNSQTCPPPVPPPPVQPPPCPSSHVSPASVRQTVHSSVLQSCS